jgi:cytochrome c oxidase subunit IV
MSHAETKPAVHREKESYGHIVSLPILFAVFAALLAMTFFTVAATWYNLGEWNLPLAMGIATFKAALVLLYFMHLRYDNPFNAIVLLTALLFVALFISITLLDTYQYQSDIQSFPKTSAVTPTPGPSRV